MRNSSSERAGKGVVEPFIYRDQRPPAEAATEPEPEPQPSGIGEEEMRAREQRARREAREETERGLGADLEHRVELEHAAVLEALQQFEQHRHDYFLRLEREVVQLVLAIARKVLQREADLDPLLLAGTVRVALDQLAAGTQVDLFVPLSKMAQWEQLLKREPAFAAPPQLRSDPTLEPVGCRLETSTGTTELGLETQLGAIEHEFDELLNRRTALLDAAMPKAAAAAAS